MITLSVIIPVFNEEDTLKVFVERLFASFIKINTEYIFINDGSTDKSSEILNNVCNKDDINSCKLINLTKNSGKGNAIHEGLKIANGQYILFQDADLELDTNDSLEMLNMVTDNPSINCLFGSRYLSGKLKKNNNYLNEFVGKFNSFLFNILFKQSLSDLHCGTKIISKEILDSLKLSIKDFGFEIDIASQIAKKNYDIYEYGISYFARSKDEGKKITWVDGLQSYYYLFKTRFLQNDLFTTVSIIISLSYMSYVGSYFGMGNGKVLMIFFFAVCGLFIGLHKKILSSLFIFLFLYLGSLFSYGNGKIYTVLLGFIIGTYISGILAKYIKKHMKNDFFKLLF